MLENQYQAMLIQRLKIRFPGCIVLKNDTSYRQGIPDLTVLFVGGFWAVLEVKASARAPMRPNQNYYVGLLDEMSFAAFIYPENEEDVLHDLQRAYEASRSARIS